MNNEEKLLALEDALKRLNGVNVIIEDEQGRILVGRSTYGEKKFMLPGGAVERGELYKHATVTETQEETGYIIQEENLELIAYFVQRIKNVQSASGTVFLYKTNKSEKDEILSSSPEMTDVQFMSCEDILKRQQEFGLGYFRMILMFMRIKAGYEKAPKEARLSDTVEYFVGGDRYAA